jgi:hypothetical protein
MAQMSYKMYNQNFQQFYYSANCYNAYFYNKTEVLKTVLVNITSEEHREIIYSDPQYGMHSGKSMAIWTAAYMQAADKPTGWEEPPMQVLIDHFTALNVELTDVLLLQLVNN